ncbi:hypothetical protein Scep_014166 [Stephania cephalantha]|uniref:Uncharacterized protein n=1 Tax=Stephania cephalantha TaxID=152367 RepID=A0AAP0P1E3_9MAGN
MAGETPLPSPPRPGSASMAEPLSRPPRPTTETHNNNEDSPRSWRLHVLLSLPAASPPPLPFFFFLSASLVCVGCVRL